MCSFSEEIQTQCFNIYNINIFFSHNWIERELRSRTLLESGKVAGSATYKQ